MKQEVVSLIVTLQVLLLEPSLGFSLFDRKCHIKKVPSQWFPRPIAIHVGHDCYPYRKDDGSSDEPIMPDMESRCCACVPPGTKTTPTIERVSTTRPPTGLPQTGTTVLQEVSSGQVTEGGTGSSEGGSSGGVEGGSPGVVEGGSTETVEGGTGSSEGGLTGAPDEGASGAPGEGSTESPGEGGLTEGATGDVEGGVSEGGASKAPPEGSTELPEGSVTGGPGEVAPTGEPRGGSALSSMYPGEVSDGFDTEEPDETDYPGEVTPEGVSEGTESSAEPGNGIQATETHNKPKDLEEKIEQLIEDISHLQCKNESSLEGIIEDAKDLQNNESQE